MDWTSGALGKLPPQHVGHEHGAGVFPLGSKLPDESEELEELDQPGLDIELKLELGLDHEL
ncbi:MAG TPA: hypothetical protein VHV55_05980 [Pirellulales bacterium]|nr:hypothetical protein [Pirellulales bacterium]